MKKIYVLLCLIVLTACAIKPSQTEMANADYGSYPDNYREIIKTYLNKTLKDPESARFDSWEPPRMGWNGFGGSQYGFIVCVNVNAKNSYGGYVGSRPNFFMIKNGEITRTLAGDGQYMDGMINGFCGK